MKKKIIMLCTIPLGSNYQFINIDRKYDENYKDEHYKDEYYKDEYCKLKLGSIYGECKPHNDSEHTSKDKKTKRASTHGVSLYQLLFLRNILDRLGY